MSLNDDEYDSDEYRRLKKFAYDYMQATSEPIVPFRAARDSPSLHSPVIASITSARGPHPSSLDTNFTDVASPVVAPPFIESPVDSSPGAASPNDPKTPEDVQPWFTAVNTKGQRPAVITSGECSPRESHVLFTAREKESSKRHIPIRVGAERPRKQAKGRIGQAVSRSPETLPEESAPRPEIIKGAAQLTKAATAKGVPTKSTTMNGSTGALQPPDWYQNLNKSKKRPKFDPVKDTKLANLHSKIVEFLDAAEDKLKVLPPKKSQELIDLIHESMFFEVTGQILRDHYLLHNNNGLPCLFNANHMKMDFPYYVRADAEELYNNWSRRLFKPDILHGIKYDKSSAPSLVKDYALRRQGNFHGNNGLVNGQWFPSQLCTVRDGAHHSAQGGISGSAGEGAWSVVLSTGACENGLPYENIDQGDVVLYCGTDGKNGLTSENTDRMMENVQNHKPVRLIRSYNCRNEKYRPKQGFRYDGLYDVVSQELLKGHEKDQRYRFRLVRQEGQDPIRHAGPGARPTQQELDAYKKIKDFKEFLNPQ